MAWRPRRLAWRPRWLARRLGWMARRLERLARRMGLLWLARRGLGLGLGSRLVGLAVVLGPERDR